MAQPPRVVERVERKKARELFAGFCYGAGFSPKKN
jgi:hypothetical protein